LSGKNTIRFRMLKDGTRVQIDLNHLLVLLCYKKGVPQKGQPESCRSRTRTMV
jgi:hypothetical protein